jgi:hypothetical protein
MTRQQCPGAGFLLSALVSGMRGFYHLSQSSRASRNSLSNIWSDLDLNAVLRLTRLNVNSLPFSHRGCLPRVSCLNSEHAPHSCRVYCVRFHRRQSAREDKRPAHRPQLKAAIHNQTCVRCCDVLREHVLDFGSAQHLRLLLYLRRVAAVGVSTRGVRMPRFRLVSSEVFDSFQA